MAHMRRSPCLGLVAALSLAGAYLVRREAFVVVPRTRQPALCQQPGSCTESPAVVFGHSTPQTSRGTFVTQPVLGLVALALAAGCSRTRASSTARRAREVVVEVTNEVPLTLETATVGQLDSFMEKNATEVCIQNVQRIEDDPDKRGVKRCYLEPNDMGPFRSQMRITLRVDLPESGRCDTTILNMENGSVDKKTGEVTFPEDANNFKFDTSNVITWKDNGEGGLELKNDCFAKSVMTLPAWFPLPDSLLQSLSTAFVRKIISTGQEKVMDQMKLSFVAWQEARQDA